jgi:hypothetical protein
MSRILRISGFMPSFRHTSALRGVRVMRDGGGLIFDEVTVDTWLKTSSKLIGGTPFLFLDFLFPLELTETMDGDLGGEFIPRLLCSRPVDHVNRAQNCLTMTKPFRQQFLEINDCTYNKVHSTYTFILLELGERLVVLNEIQHDFKPQRTNHILRLAEALSIHWGRIILNLLRKIPPQ